MQLGPHCLTGYIPAFSCCCFIMTNGEPVLWCTKQPSSIWFFLHIQERQVFGRVPLPGGLGSLSVSLSVLWKISSLWRHKAKCFYIYNNFPSSPLIANTLDFLVDNISVISSFHPNQDILSQGRKFIYIFRILSSSVICQSEKTHLFQCLPTAWWVLVDAGRRLEPLGSTLLPRSLHSHSSFRYVLAFFVSKLAHCHFFALSRDKVSYHFLFLIRASAL